MSLRFNFSISKEDSNEEVNKLLEYLNNDPDTEVAEKQEVEGWEVIVWALLAMFIKDLVSKTDAYKKLVNKVYDLMQKIKKLFKSKRKRILRGVYKTRKVNISSDDSKEEIEKKILIIKAWLTR